MERTDLLKHLRATHFESGDRGHAVADAGRIARFLHTRGAERVVGIGSAFDSRLPFTHRSDIDLVATGIHPGRFFAVSADAQALTSFALDLKPMESATPALARVVDDRGVEL